MRTKLGALNILFQRMRTKQLGSEIISTWLRTKLACALNWNISVIVFIYHQINDPRQ